MPKQIVNISDTVKTFQEKVNIISTDVGWRGSLTTTEDSDIVGAINEHDAELGTITAGAMGTTASTVSTAIAELDGLPEQAAAQTAAWRELAETRLAAFAALDDLVVTMNQ